MNPELDKIMLNRFSRFEPLSMESAPVRFTEPCYERMVFLDEEKRKEWEEMPESEKAWLMDNLKSTAQKMENKIAIEMLCNVVADLYNRVKELENK
jgi:hypothetical protein